MALPLPLLKVVPYAAQGEIVISFSFSFLHVKSRQSPDQFTYPHRIFSGDRHPGTQYKVNITYSAFSFL